MAFVYLICFCCWYCQVATKANEPATKTNSRCYSFDFSFVFVVGRSFALLVLCLLLLVFYLLLLVPYLLLLLVEFAVVVGNFGPP